LIKACATPGTHTWEQRKLRDIANKTYGGGTPKTSVAEFWDGDIPWIQSQDLIEDQLHDVQPRKHITEEAIASSATKKVPENSLAIITRVGVGKLAFIPFSYCTSQDFMSLSELQTNGDFSAYAIYKMLQAEKGKTQGTSIKGITTDELLNKSIMVPSLPEQEQIGVFFRNLDSTITLHQRELKRVEIYRKINITKCLCTKEVCIWWN